MRGMRKHIASPVPTTFLALSRDSSRAYVEARTRARVHFGITFERRADRARAEVPPR